MNRYHHIYSILKDFKWHKKSEFCRPYSSDDKRLRECRLKGWLTYEKRITRKDEQVIFTEYKITEITESGRREFGERQMEFAKGGFL